VRHGWRDFTPMMDIPEISPPSKRSRAWVAEEFGAGASVVAAKRLTGGITSAMHLLTIVEANGQRHRAVLRRWMESEHTDGPSGYDKRLTY